MKKIAFLLLLGVALSPLRAAMEVIVSDDFNLDGKDRLEGLSLNGLPPQKGSGGWKVPISNNTVLSAAGNVTNMDMAPTSAVEGLIEIDTPTVPIIVQADAVTKSAGWVAVGFLASDATAWFDARNLLFALLQSDGSWVVFRGGSLVQLATGKVPQYLPEESTNLGLKYDPRTGKAFVLINGEIVSAEIDAGLDPVAKITASGFYIYLAETSEPGLASVDNFKVSLERP